MSCFKCCTAGPVRKHLVCVVTPNAFFAREFIGINRVYRCYIVIL